MIRLLSLIIVIIIMSACTPTPNYIKVCKDANDLVVEDTICQSSNPALAGAAWWFLAHRNGGYAVGSRVEGGSASVEPHARITSNAEARQRVSRPVRRPGAPSRRSRVIRRSRRM